MSQFPTLAFDGQLSGEEVLDDLGAALEAIQSMNGGDNDPPLASIRPYSWFFDSDDVSLGGSGVIKLRNGTNTGWIPIFNVVGTGADGIEIRSRNAGVVTLGLSNTFLQPQLIIPTSALGSLTVGSQQGGGGIQGRLGFQARDDASADRLVAAVDADVVNSSAASLTAQLKLRSILSGTLADRFRLGASLFAEGLSDTAAGSVNATELLRNGVALDTIIAAADIRAVDVQTLAAGAAVDLDLATNLHFLHTFTGDRTLNFDNAAANKVGRMGILTLTASGGDRTVTLADDNGIAIAGDLVTDQALAITSGSTRKFIFVVRSTTEVRLYELAGSGAVAGFSSIEQFTITTAQSNDDFLRMQEIAEGETQHVTLHDIQQTNNNDSSVLLRVSTNTTQRTSGYKSNGDLGVNNSDSGIKIGRVGEINDRLFGEFWIRRTNGVVWVRASVMTSEYLSAGGDVTVTSKVSGSYAGGLSFDRWYIDFTNTPNTIATGSKYTVRRNWL